jgi:hypothetical protein
MAESWSKGSKIAILTCDPSAKHPMYLLNESAGSWDDNGIWWSNQSHKRTVSTQLFKPIPPAHDIDELWDIAIEADTELCPYCESVTDMVDNPYYCCNLQVML